LTVEGESLDASSLTGPGDTYVRSDFPTTTYQSYDPTELEIGTYNGGASIARAFINFGGGSFWRDTVITGASLTLYEFHAYNCTASAIYAQYSGIESAATDWNNQPARSSTYEGHTTVSKGGGTACPGGSFAINVAPIIIRDAQFRAGTMGMALVAGSEGADTGWKRVYSADESTVSVRPKLAITYFHTPNSGSSRCASNNAFARYASTNSPSTTGSTSHR
jgi:hypothetical protein